MRFHIPNLPHTQTTDEYSWCAYTMKVKKFADMMHSLGHEVYLYGGEKNEAACTEFIPCMSEDARKGYFGDLIPEFDSDHPGWSAFADSVNYELSKRKQPRDFLALIGGLAQKPIADCNPELMTVEFGVGYEGTFAQFRVFESYAWMHTLYGMQQGAARGNGISHDAVIPNSWDLSEFPLGDGSGGYLLYIGRLIERKGVQTAVQVAKKCNMKLVVAGSGDYRPWSKSDDVDYVGVVGPKERARLMGNAVATLAPTLYLEPFGGVTVEAMLCGTPAITTDWGGFTETIPSYYRCRTLPEFVAAVTRAQDENSEGIRKVRRAEAQARYGTDLVRYQYDKYFSRVANLYGGGWFQDQSFVDVLAKSEVVSVPA